MLIHVLPMRVMTFGSCLSLTPIPQTTFSTSVSQFLYRWPNSAVSCELEGRAKNKGEWTEYRITDLAGASSFSAKNDQTLHARWIADDTFSLCSLKRQTNFNIRLKFSHFPSGIHLLVVDRYVGFQIVHHISNKYVSEGDQLRPEEDNGLTREK